MSKTKFDDQIQDVEDTSTTKGKTEATEKEIEEVTRKDDARLEKEKKHTVHQAWTWVLWAVIGCCVAALIVITLNYLLPEHWCWITEEKRHIMTTGFLSTLVGYIVKSAQKYL